MTKIILGTSKLGWDTSVKNYNNQIEVIEFFLRKNYQIHISASYGYSLNRIRKIKILNKSKSPFLLKISFNNQENFIHELIYSSMMIGSKKKIDIQVDEFFQTKNLISFLQTMQTVKKLVNINKILFTPMTYNQNEFLKKKISKFNFAIHYSFVERSVKNSFLSNKKRKKIVALRALGKGLRNFSFNDFYNKQISFNHKRLNSILLKLNLSELEARALYMFNNKAFDKVVISTSKLKNLLQLLKLERKKLEVKKWKILEKYSNKNFTIQKANKPLFQNSFTKRHNPLIFFKSLNLLRKKNLISKKYFLVSIYYLNIGFINLIINFFKIKIISLLK